MSEITLTLSPREVSGKKVSSLRKQGVIPSVVYGGKGDAVNTQSDLVATTKVVRSAGRHTPVNLVVDGKKRLAIIKSIALDPVNRRLKHVSFHAIKQNEVITTEVSIHLLGLGESLAERAGLVVLQALEQVSIKAKPADLPESLEVSVEKLEAVTDKLLLSDVKLPSGVEFADAEQDVELVVANVYEPSALQAQNEAAAGDAEEPSADGVEAENGTAEEATTEEATDKE